MATLLVPCGFRPWSSDVDSAAFNVDLQDARMMACVVTGRERRGLRPGAVRWTHLQVIDYRMPTEIRMWQVSEGQLKPIQDASFGASHRETDLEDWIEKNPAILDDDLLVISRQLSIEGVGRLDLLRCGRNALVTRIGQKSRSRNYSQWPRSEASAPFSKSAVK